MPIDQQLGNDPSGQETGDVVYTYPSKYGDITFSAPRGTPATPQALAPYIVPRFQALEKAALANQAVNQAPGGFNDPSSPSGIATPTVNPNSFASLAPDEQIGKSAQVLAQSRAIQRANTLARERMSEEAAATVGGIAGGIAAGALVSGVGPEAGAGATLLTRGGAALARGGIRAGAMALGTGTGQAVGSAYADAAMKAGESMGYLPKMEDQKIDQVWTRAHDQFYNGLVTGAMGEATLGTARVGRNLVFGIPTMGPALKAMEGRVADAAAQKLSLAVHNVTKSPVVGAMRKVLSIFPIVGDTIRKNENAQIAQAEGRLRELFLNPFVPVESIATLSDRAINNGGIVRALYSNHYSAAAKFYTMAEEQASKSGATWNPVNSIGGGKSLKDLALDLLDAERTGQIPSLHRTYSQSTAARTTVDLSQAKGEVFNQEAGTINPFDRITAAGRTKVGATATEKLQPTVVPNAGEADIGDFVDALANMDDGTKLGYQQMSQLGRTLNVLWRRAGKIGDNNLIAKVGALKNGFSRMVTSGTDEASNKAFLDANRAFATEMALYERPTARKLEDIYSNVFTQQGTMIPGGSYPDQLFTSFFNDAKLMASPAAHADLRALVGDNMYRLGIANHINNKVSSTALKAGTTITQNWDALRASLGLLKDTNTPQRDALKAMLRESGLDKKGVTPEAMEQFLEVAQRELPDQLPDLSTMQLRRATLGGTQSALGLGLAVATLGASPFLQWHHSGSVGPVSIAIPMAMAVSMNRLGSWMTDPAKLTKLLAYAKAPASSGFKTQIAIQATRWAAEDLAHARAYLENRTPSESDIHDAEMDIMAIPPSGVTNSRPLLRHPGVMR